MIIIHWALSAPNIKMRYVAQMHYKVGSIWMVWRKDLNCLIEAVYQDATRPRGK